MHPPLSVGPWHASFMMPAAVTNALHEEQASIMRVSRFCVFENPSMTRHATRQSLVSLVYLGA